MLLFTNSNGYKLSKKIFPDESLLQTFKLYFYIDREETRLGRNNENCLLNRNGQFCRPLKQSISYWRPYLQKKRPIISSFR